MMSAWDKLIGKMKKKEEEAKQKIQAEYTK